LYEYGHRQVKLNKKRGNNKEIWLKINILTEIKKKRKKEKEKGGNCVSRVPANWECILLLPDLSKGVNDTTYWNFIEKLLI